jgi:DNA-binding MarR family transcriptional regulator
VNEGSVNNNECVKQGTEDVRVRIPSVTREAQVSTLINLAARLTNKAARIRLGSIGAWPGQISVLVWLLEEEGVTQKELVERASIEQSTMAEHLDRLEADGLVYRERDKEDGRKYRIFLTDKAKETSRDLLSELEAGARIFTKGINQADLRVFDRVMRQIITNLDGYISQKQ